jgi:hypothetical protein
MYVNSLSSWETYVSYEDCELTLQSCADEAQSFISTRLYSSSLLKCAVLTWVTSTGLYSSFSYSTYNFLNLSGYLHAKTAIPINQLYIYNPTFPQNKATWFMLTDPAAKWHVSTHMKQTQKFKCVVLTRTILAVARCWNIHN